MLFRVFAGVVVVFDFKIAVMGYKIGYGKVMTEVEEKVWRHADKDSSIRSRYVYILIMLKKTRKIYSRPNANAIPSCQLQAPPVQGNGSLESASFAIVL